MNHDIWRVTKSYWEESEENTSRFCVCFILIHVELVCFNLTKPTQLSGNQKTSMLLALSIPAVELHYVCNGLMFTCKIQTSNPISSCVECLQICLKIYCIRSEFNKSKKRYITVFPKAPTCPFSLCGSDVRDEILHSGPYRPKTQTSLYRPGPRFPKASLA